MNGFDRIQSTLFAQFAIINYEFYCQSFEPVMILFELNFYAGLNWSIRGMNRLLCQHSHNDWNDLVEFMFPVDKAV